MGLRALAVVVALVFASSSMADELSRAQELAWSKEFAESEVLYRLILKGTPGSYEAQIGLARVVMWQGRYTEAIALFDAVRPQDTETMEGRATAAYWDGDLRAAARDFRRVLALDPSRELARRSLEEITSTARPSQRVTVVGSQDDQPLDSIRAEVAATFFTDPQTQWTVAVSRYHLDASRFAHTADGESVTLGNETTVRGTTAWATLGFLTFPDGARRAIGSVGVRRRSLTLRIERNPDMASATSLATHSASTTTTLRWDHDRVWIGAAEVSHRRYSDANSGRAAVGYAVFPLRGRGWTLWSGASMAARDTDQSRFVMTAVSSTREASGFSYRYRGEYDPYWTPDDLLEARAVLAVERRHARGGLKLHGDAGYGRDRGRAFGPNNGPGPFPSAPFTFAFDRTYRPWRYGMTVDLSLTHGLKLEAGVERSVTIDYRATAFHATLVRRR